jgi:hypothetical protein
VRVGPYIIARRYTYWYLTATPELLRAAGARFAPTGVVEGEP